MFPVTALVLSLFLALSPLQSDERPSYAREGDRIEEEFLAHRDRLIAFFSELRSALNQQTVSASVTLPQLQPQDVPPSAGVRFGYGVLPRLVDNPSANVPVSVFSYSWPITDGYIAGERIKLDRAEEALHQAVNAPAGERVSVIANLVSEYRKLVTNQSTIDQYIQYNQFWQHAIAEDRPRFDQLTKVYEMLKSDEPDVAQAIREVLGKPTVPSFVQIDQFTPQLIVVRVPVYTDIDDDEFLERAGSAVENMWKVDDGGITYEVQIEFRKLPPTIERGTRIDVKVHAAGFPEDGAVLTTGAQTTHSLVGRYVALAPGDLSARTLAHEFGHLIAWHYGTDAFNGAGPAGFPYSGQLPEEMWADCVATAFTGTSFPTRPLSGCPSDALAFTSRFLASGPGPRLR